MKKTILMVVLFPFFAGCATAPKTPPPKQPAVYARAADQALLAEWEGLVAAETGDRAREAINHSRMPEGQAHLAVMRGEKAVWTPKQLGWSQAYVSNGIAAIRSAKTWPEPPAYGVARAAGAITIDGKGTEPDWARAVAIPIRYPYAQTNVIDRPPATCRLLWDAKNLYLLFEASDTNIVNLCAARDDAVSQGDCVEIFLLPSRRFGQYWEFNFSPTGVVFDALTSKSWTKWGGDSRMEEQAALTIATTLAGTLNREDDQDRGYAVEVALPWPELPGFQHGAGAGDTLWTMIGWADKAALGAPGNPAYFSHTPVLAWFHNIWGYSRLTLE
jgi:hypothetical protein